jgi:membrane-associated phospholipid phosphatase
VLKEGVGRRRPNSHSKTSFPSGHASDAAVFATLTARNLDSIDLPYAERLSLSASSYVLAGAVAWARVEGQRHYPSDVLAGAAIGHFFGVFIHDAFLGLPENGVIPFVEVSPFQGGARAEVSWLF